METKKTREQLENGALEYMMTYGWAIFIIVIAAAVLYSMGIFNPPSSTVVSTVVNSTATENTTHLSTCNVTFINKSSGSSSQGGELGRWIIYRFNTSYMNSSNISTVEMFWSKSPSSYTISGNSTSYTYTLGNWEYSERIGSITFGPSLGEFYIIPSSPSSNGFGWFSCLTKMAEKV